MDAVDTLFNTFHSLRLALSVINLNILSDWYELTTGDDLMQGDVLESCPIFRPSVNMTWPIEGGSEGGSKDADFTVGVSDMIIITQSCDLKLEQKPDMWLVILCPIWKLSKAAKVNQHLASSIGKEDCRRGHMPGYHMISGCNDERWRREISIVSFREVISLPLDYVRKFARNMTPRVRLRSPYREHLAQAFARYFMRVGLPSEIPPFSSTRTERLIYKGLKSIDETTRNELVEPYK